MSRLAKEVKRTYSKGKRDEILRVDETVTNFMGGDSYVINPLDTLKMVTASSIFGEPSYYRDSHNAKAGYKLSEFLSDDAILSATAETTTQIFTTCIDDALSYNFEETLKWAVELRRNFYMRLNPQVIMVRAAIHPNREFWSKENPGKFKEYEMKVMMRADEPATQLAYYLWLKGSKSCIPSLLKRSLACKLSTLDKYSVSKYKNAEIGMINAVRLTHANSEILDELMTTGTVKVDENEKTWENLRSEGKSWVEIFNAINMGHMAMLRNLRGVFEETDNLDFCKSYMSKLKDGVLKGKQFPFRYMSAMNAVKNSNVNHKQYILDTLEECMDIACDNMPHLNGKTMCLSDNSGSAWGVMNSEYGTVTVAQIDNLSSVITAHNSDEGIVGKFGDTIKYYEISRHGNILEKSEEITSNRSRDVGGSTEGGIWEFFRDAIKNKIWYDNIFIYSDQQAGHGGLYGTSEHEKEYGEKYGCGHGWTPYINVYKLILEYRNKVNPKVNVFSVQTAGYNNVLVPENAYRTSILYGWTGKELVYADAINKMWDDIDSRNNK